MINAFVSGITTVQFPSPALRQNSGPAPRLFQPTGFDSNGDQYVYDKSYLSRTAYTIVQPGLSDALKVSLKAFASATVRGSFTSFTWYDNNATPHTVRLAGAIEFTRQGPDRHTARITLTEEVNLAFPVVADFATAMTAKSSAPVWILKLTVNSVDYYLSDSTFTITGWQSSPVTTLPWIRQWGERREAASGDFNEIKIADITVTCIIDRAASPNLESLATTYPLEKSPAELYLWFHGLNAATQPPRLMDRGYINEYDIPDDTTITLTIEDEVTRLYGYLGTKIDLATYPSADPDDVGKIIPIPFGTVDRLPAVAVNAGVLTTVAGIPPGSTSTTPFAMDHYDNSTHYTGWLPETNAYDGNDTTYAQALIANFSRSGTISFTNLRRFQLALRLSQGTPGSPYDYVEVYYKGSLIQSMNVGNYGTTVTDVRSDWITCVDPGDMLTAAGTYAKIHMGGSLRLHEVSWVCKDGAIVVNAPQEISDSNVSFHLTDGSKLTAGRVVTVDDEDIKILAITGNLVTNCQRGYSIVHGNNRNTAAVSHDNGSVVWERKTTFDYIVSDIPLTSIDKVFGILGQEELEITPVCTLYTGNPGDGHSRYPGKAVVTIPGLITAQQAVNLGLTGGVSIDNGDLSISDLLAIVQGNHAHTTGSSQSAVQMDHYDNSTHFTGWTSEANALDGNTSTYTTAVITNYHTDATISASGMTKFRLQATLSYGYPGTPYDYIEIYYKGSLVETMNVGNFGSTLTTVLSGWVTCSNPNDLQGASGTYARVHIGATLRVHEIDWVVEIGGTATSTSNAAGVGRTGTITLTGSVSGTSTHEISGNSVANTLVGDKILCNVTSPITDLDDVTQWLVTKGGSSGTVAVSGSIPAGYSVNGAITEYKRNIDWLNKIAFEFRCYFRMLKGVPSLIVRPDTLTSTRTISTICLDTSGKRVYSRQPAQLTRILNKVEILYNRDWSQPAGDKAYRGLAKGSGSGIYGATNYTYQTSIDNYGTRERPELFKFDFVTSYLVAEAVREFYINRYSVRKWLHKLRCYLEQSDLAFADVVTLGFNNNLVGEIQEMGLTPGDSQTMDTVALTIEV